MSDPVIDELSAYGPQLQNAAVLPDGIELAFEGDKCGHSYRIKKNCIGNWEVYFFDWHEGGWFDIRKTGFTRHEAIETCNKHAIEKRLLKFLPTRAKYKPNWGGWGSAATVSVATEAISALFGGLLGL